MTTSSGERDHLVVTVHGIRTFGFWQERLEALLRSDATGEERHRIEVLNYKYGYFSAIAFMIPLLRWLVVRQFRRTLEKQLARRSWRRVDIVAHSFGTHLVGWSLLAMKNGPHRVHTVIVAGSVLRSDFPWNELIGTTVRRVVSECGTSDSILLLSQFFVLFTGMAGRVGFSGMTGETLRNRFYEIGHSGYFLSAGRPSDDFMAANWLPLLARDEAVALRDDPRSAGALDGLKTWITNNMEPVKLTAYVLPLVAVIVWVLSLYIAGEANRRVSDAARTASIASMRLGPDATPEMARARLQSALAAARTFRSLGADGSPATIALASATRDVPKRIATIAAANPLVAFDARSRFAAVAEGKELRIIDALSGRTRAAWTLTDALTAIAIHPRADEVAVGDSRGSLTTIDLVSKRGKRSTHEMNGPVESVVYNDTGEVLGAVAREPSAAAVRIVDSSDRLLASDTYALTIEGKDAAPLPQLAFSGTSAAVLNVTYEWERQGVNVLALGSSFRMHHDDHAEAAFFDDQGSLLTLVDGGIRRRNLVTGQDAAPLQLPKDFRTIDQWLVSPRRDLLAIRGDSTEDPYLPALRYTFVRVYSVRTGTLLAELARESVDAVAFSGDSSRIAIADGREVRVYRSTTGQFETIVELTKPATKIALSGDGRTLFATEDGGPAEMWSVADARELTRLPAVNENATPLISADEQFAAAYQGDQPVKIWSVADGVQRLSFVPRQAVTGALFGGSELAVAIAHTAYGLPTGTSEITLHDARSGKRTLEYAANDVVSSMAFDRNATLFAAGTNDGNVLIWKKKNGAWSGPAKHRLGKGVLSAVAVSPDGRYIAAGSGLVLALREPGHDDRLRVCAIDKLDGGPKNCHLIAPIRGGVNDVTFSSDGRHVAAGSGASRAFVFDHLQATLTRKFEHHLGYVQKVRFADGARSLVTLSTEVASRGLGAYTIGTALDVWSVADGARTDHRGLERAGDAVWNVTAPVLHGASLAPDGTIAAVVFRNLIEYMAPRASLSFPDVVSWRVAGGKLVETFRDETRPRVNALAAAPAHLVAVDAATSTVSVMATDPRRLFAVACAAAGEPAACRDPETTADVIQRASILGSTAPAVSSQIVAIGAAALWRSRAALYLGGALLSIVAVVVARRLATHSRAAFAAAAVFAVACAAMAIRYLPNHEESAAGTIRVATAREEVPPSTLPVVRATPAAPHDSGAHQLVEEKTRRVIAKVLGVEYEKVTPFTEVPRNAKVSCHVALQEAFDVDFPWSDVPNTVLGLVELIERLPKGRIRFSLPS